jgi:predicted aspartyl protease
MTFPYDVTYFPPFPTLEVTLSTPAEGLTTDTVTALVDTGSDATFVPLEHLSQIGAVETTEMWARSHWSERRRVLLYLVDVQVGHLTLPGIEVVGDDLGNEILVGRDVLNCLRLLLDGPGEVSKLISEG